MGQSFQMVEEDEEEQKKIVFCAGQGQNASCALLCQ